jgi:hypothetical protein
MLDAQQLKQTAISKEVHWDICSVEKIAGSQQ